MINTIFINQSVKKMFNDYMIILVIKDDFIKIQIQKNDTYEIYESKFNLEYLRKNKLLMANFTLEEIIQFIEGLINQKNIKIENNNMDLKFTLISPLPIVPNVELILNKKDIQIYILIEKLFNEIKEIKEENKKLNKRIELIEKNNINTKFQIIKNDNNLLKERIELIEDDNKKFKKRSDLIEKKFNRLNQIIKENKQKDKNIELENNIKLKKYMNNEIDEDENENIEYIDSDYNNNESKTSKFNLKFTKSIELKSFINSMSTFPSGNIISVSTDKSIKIYDIHLNELQNIKNAHNDSIIYVEIKNEKNFITCSEDKSIKSWIKKENQFRVNKIINNAHDDKIIKVIYCSNGDLISCSHDNSIKIWKEYNNGYKNIVTLNHLDVINSILYLEDKNILISSGLDGTKFWSLNKNNYFNIKCIKYLEKTRCEWNGTLCRLDKDTIISQGIRSDIIQIISILNFTIIKVINNPFQCTGIKLIKNKGIFLVGGWSKNIIIYSSDNYECIKNIKNAHTDLIIGFVELKDGTIISYSNDQLIQIWNF